MRRTYRPVVTWLDQALTCASEAIERMPDDRFLAEHAAVHAEPRSGTLDQVACAFERDWRRWPEGREE
ncbi:hypothetical protein X739_05925 [Mesorhizobium sp. LNHC220B00]|nr:hypothetical protein [Mesorhizobium sp. LNHC220B00]ESY88044.1 hypothetical protein X739_05925 [Mesorhizobium sp. LNHC220B00]